MDMKKVVATGSGAFVIGLLVFLVLRYPNAIGGEERRSEDREFKAVAFGSDQGESTRKLNALAADGWDYVGQLKGEGLVAFIRRTDAAKAEKDVEKLQGSWDLVAEEADGKKKDPLQFATWRIEGNKIRFESSNKGTFTLNPTRKPTAIDAYIEGVAAPFDEVSVVSGIYSLEGDNLTICFELTGTGRPKEFVTKHGLSVILYKLKRAKR
jgi:uncharacterized protein (TIGR03067 family)